MTALFPEIKILKVTPGKPSQYIHQSEVIDIPENPIISRLSLDENVTVATELTLYTKQIRTTKKCRKHISNTLSGQVFLKLQWRFHDFVQLIHSPECLRDIRLKFDFRAQYQIDIDADFVSTIDRNPVIFELYALNNTKEILLSRSELYVGNILNSINKKQQTKVVFVNNTIDSSSHVAILDLWYKFTSNKKNMKSLCSEVSSPGSSDTRKIKEQIPKELNEVFAADSEVDLFAENLLLVLNRNKDSKTSQTDLNQVLEEQVRWLRYEANWKQTLQENTILHGKNLHDRQWRKESTSEVKLRTYDESENVQYKPELSITIVKLHFLADTTVLKNQEIEQVYVEYQFLGQEGPEMETPFSVPVGTISSPCVFNFTRTFSIDAEKDYKNCTMLTQMIKNKGILKFIIVGEPRENIDRPIQTCQEVGYAEVNFEDIVQLEDNVDIYQYEILDFHNPIDVVGYVTIKFEGILALRKMALMMMAPKGYNLFM